MVQRLLERRKARVGKVLTTGMIARHRDVDIDIAVLSAGSLRTKMKIACGIGVRFRISALRTQRTG